MTKNLETRKGRGISSPVPYLPESTVGDQAFRKAGAPSRIPLSSAPAKTTLDEQTLHERIAEKAYELYQKRGQSRGRDLEDWLEAERLILAELKSRSGNRISKPRRRTRRSKKE